MTDKNDWATERTGTEKFFAELEGVTVLVDASTVTDEQMAKICGCIVLVRCRDCKHFLSLKDDEGTRNMCLNNGIFHPNDDDFCSYGERN